MAKDIQGIGLGLASRFAGSEWANTLKIRKPIERLIYSSTKAGFQLAGKMGQKRQSKKTPNQAAQNSRTKQIFDLSLTEEQEMIKGSVRAYASEVVRGLAAQANEEQTLPENFLQDISALGLNLFSVPEHLGGAAQAYSPTTIAIISEELAWGDFSLAMATLAPVAVANALVRWGTKEQQQTWLPLWLAEEPMRACIAVQENHPLFDAKQLNCKAKRTRTGFEISGEKTLIPLGGNAQMYLVAAQCNNSPQLFIVAGNSKGLSFKSAPAMGLRAAETGTLLLDKVKVKEDAMLGGSKGSKKDTFNYQDFIDLGQLHWCALALGTCQAALDYAITYANERIAFGEPISHRQSVAFMISNMAIELEAMRLLTWRAAALAEQGRPFHREAYLAHLQCTEKAMQIGNDCVQILGGHGFTKEHPAERWYRDLRILSCVNSGLHL